MPPLPVAPKARAMMVPAKSVAPFDQIVTCPPLPARFAEAEIDVFASMVTLLAVVRPATGWPWAPPPIVARPPPVAPFTLSFALLSAMDLPPMATVPPALYADAALTGAATVTVPPSPPSRMIAPPSRRAELAESAPSTFTALRIASLTVAALTSMRPPAALTRPDVSINAWPLAGVACVGSATCRKPSPFRSRVACSPEPRPILPSGAEIVPVLFTLPPIRPTMPPGAVWMAPALETFADAPLPEKFSRPALKSASPMSRVEATKPPPTVTVPPGVMAIPFGLTR